MTQFSVNVVELGILQKHKSFQDMSVGAFSFHVLFCKNWPLARVDLRKKKILHKWTKTT